MLRQSSENGLETVEVRSCQETVYLVVKGNVCECEILGEFANGRSVRKNNVLRIHNVAGNVNRLSGSIERI